MSTPQSGIFQPEATMHHAMEWRLRDGHDPSDLCRAVAEVHDRLARHDADNQVRFVLAFSGDALRQLGLAHHCPASLRPFDQIDGASGRKAPATQRDILVWLHGERRDRLFDAAMQSRDALTKVATVELEVPGFQYHDSRDLTGFVDGSANPKGNAIGQAALVPQGQPGAGGSFVLSQKWVHDLPAFNALAVADQERVIGRTKPDSIELEGDAMPTDSHVSRTDAKVDGVAQKIYRRSFPYGTTGEHGLYFLAFGTEISRFDVLLRRMYGTSGDGLSDHLLRFSRAVSGSYWFAPAADLIPR